jgi:hypothetical protein
VSFVISDDVRLDDIYFVEDFLLSDRKRRVRFVG